MAAQSIRTSALSRRAPHAWMASAQWSFPTPDSPTSSTLTSCAATFAAVCRSVRIEAFFVRTKSVSAGSRRRFAAGIPWPFRLARKFGRHVRRISPEALQPIEPARVLGEDVHDEIAEVDQDPAARRRPFDQQRPDALFGAHLLHHR